MSALVPAHVTAQVTSRALVTNGGSNNVTAIYTSDRTTYTLPAGAGPFSSVTTEDGRRAYVTNTTDNTVTALDLTTGTVAATITGFDFPFQIVLAPDGKTAYVANVNGTTVSVVDLTSNTIVDNLPVGAGPAGLAITPDGKTLFVVASGSDELYRVDLTSSDPAAPTTVGSFPFGVAITADGQKAYVTNGNANDVSVVDYMNGTVTSIPVGSAPQTITMSRDEHEVWVANLTGDTVSVIDTTSDTVVATIQVDAGPGGIAFTNDGKLAYVVSNANETVSVIDTSTRTAAGSPIPVGSSPSGLSGFIGPNIIVPASGTPLDVANEAALQALGFRSYVNFDAGALRLTGDLTTARTFALMPTGGSIVTNGFSATLTGPVIGDGLLGKGGNGTLRLTGDATHMGTEVVAGRLVVNGTHMPHISIDHAELAGTGTLGPVTLTSSPAVVSPGDNGPGALSVSNIAFNGVTTFVVDIAGPTAGTEYDTLTATQGVVALNDATLDVHVPLNTTITPGTTFTIVTHASGTFANLPEGGTFAASGHPFSISYVGGAANNVVLTAVANLPPTVSPISDMTIGRSSVAGPLTFTIGDDFTAVSDLVVTASSSNQGLVPNEDIVIGGSGATRTLTITPVEELYGTATITVTVADDMGQSTSRTFVLTVQDPPRTYYLAEGATGSFFDTDLLLANPTTVGAPLTISYLRSDGTTIEKTLVLNAMTHETIHVDLLGGLEAATFSTVVTSTEGIPIAVERTMWWDATGYGAHTERASDGPSLTWQFAEGAQGFFKTYFLLANPQSTPNVAHVTYYRQGAPAVQRDYQLLAKSRTTIDAGDDAELRWQSFGAIVTFDQPGVAERSMYFGSDPLLSGGSASAGVTTLSDTWYLAEGATGSFFSTFVLMTNPGDEDASVTLTYLRDGDDPIVTTHTVPSHERLTIDVAGEDPGLGAAAFATSITSTKPIVVERSMYWPKPAWIESHSSAGVTAPGRAWALAEGRAGLLNHSQTFILLSNPGTVDADVTLTFMRSVGLVGVRHVTVPAQRRVTVPFTVDDPNVGYSEFGTRIDSTQPIVVERSMYSNANGVTWAAGTNATATRLPDPPKR